MRISVIGIGNILRGDDGIGILVANCLQKDSGSCEVAAAEQDIDCCLEMVRKSDILVIIDCAVMGYMPGTACVADLKKIIEGSCGTRWSHGSIINRPEFRMAFDRNNIRGIFFGIEPESTGLTDKVSPLLESHIDLYADIIDYEIGKMLKPTLHVPGH